MIKIDEEKTIHLTRGDTATIVVTAQNDDGSNYEFQKGDTLRLKVMSKKKVEEIVLTNDIIIDSNKESVEIELTSDETRIGDYINKPITYWYEVELNPDNNSTTIIGYDQQKAAIDTVAARKPDGVHQGQSEGDRTRCSPGDCL